MSEPGDLPAWARSDGDGPTWPGPDSDAALPDDDASTPATAARAGAGATPPWPAAPLGRRLLATLLDATLAGLLAWPAFALLGGELDGAVVLGVLLLAIGVPSYGVDALAGRSAGKAALGLRHGPPHEPPPPDLAQLQRFSVKWLAPVVLFSVGLGLVSIAWWALDVAPGLVGERRTLHDRLAGTRVVVEPPHHT